VATHTVAWCYVVILYLLFILATSCNDCNDVTRIMNGCEVERYSRETRLGRAWESFHALSNDLTVGTLEGLGLED
jgi:hypothetical protein